jgi:hypothetical protein
MLSLKMKILQKKVIQSDMASHNIHKNIPTNKRGTKTQKACIHEQIQRLKKIESSLQIEVDRPVIFENSLHKEKEFREMYLYMSYTEKRSIQTAMCGHCIRFAVQIDDPNILGMKIMVPGDIEGFASFFGECDCMWRRNVSCTYHPVSYDPFDMNDHNKRGRYNELARLAAPKLRKTRVELKKLEYELDNFNLKLDQVNQKRNEVEAYKASLTLNYVKRCLEEREIQVAKNQRKMSDMKKITNTPSPKKRCRNGYGRKQSTI